MSIKKQFLKSKPICKVTFEYAGTEENPADMVRVVGDFNGWNKESEAMRKLKDGSHKITLDLETGKTYAFRYLVNDEVWVNDSEADAYAPAGISDAENGLLNL